MGGDSTAPSSGGHADATDFESDQTGGGWLLFIGLTLGLLGRIASKRCPVPYTVLILLMGIVLGALDSNSIITPGLADSVSKWLDVNPHFLLLIFLPALIFGSAFSVDFHVFGREVPQHLLLAGPGVIMATSATAAFAKTCLDYHWDWATALTFGSMLSATDPVAVVALLKDLGASKRLSLLIEGESLFNDGTAMVIFIVFKDVMGGKELSAGTSLLFFGRLSFGGALLGLLLGTMTITVLGRMQFDITAQITVTVCAAYLTFMLAENTPMHLSGVLAVVTLGLVMASTGRTAIREHDSMHQFWETLEYFANTLIFLLSGIVIYEKGFHEPGIVLYDWGMLLVLYVVLHLIRAAMLLLLHPALKNIAYGLTWQEAVVVVFSGLRGAVGLVLALLLDTDDNVDTVTKQRFMFHMAGIAALTLLVNGTTSGMLVRRLGLAKPTKASVRMFENAIHHIHTHTEAAERRLRHSEFYSDADYVKVKEFLPEVLDRIRATQRALSHGVKPEDVLKAEQAEKAELEAAEPKPSGIRSILKPSKVLPRQRTEYRQMASQYVREARRRFLNLVKANYWEQYEMGMLGKVAIEQLTNAASRCQDEDERPLHEWEHLEQFFGRSSIQQWVNKIMCCGSDYLLFAALSFEYDIVVSFISAHTHVQSLFRQLVDDPTTSDIVVAESDLMVSKAQQKVSEITTNFADMARAVKTHHVLLALLRDMENVAQKLLEHGEIEQKEYDLIKVAVVEAYGRTKLPTHLVADERAMLREVGYINDLDDETFDAVSALSTRKFFNPGQVMIPSGRVIHGFFIVLRGTVVLRKPAQVGQSSSRTESLTGRIMKSFRSARSSFHAHANYDMDDDGCLFHTVDRMGPGAVIGVLSMLTNAVSMVTAVCETPVVAVYLPQSKVYSLLKSKPHPSGGPLRLVSPLEEVVCRMAAVLVAELMLKDFEAFQPAQIRQILAEAALIRPNALSPFKLTGKCILLTGSLLRPKREGLHHAVTARPPTDPDDSDEFDPTYASSSLPVYLKHENGTSEALTADDFEIEATAFAFLESDPNTWRFVSENTRLLVIPMHFVAMFNNCHDRIMESILLHRHLQKIKKTPTSGARTPSAAVTPHPDSMDHNSVSAATNNAGSFWLAPPSRQPVMPLARARKSFSAHTLLTQPTVPPLLGAPVRRLSVIGSARGAAIRPLHSPTDGDSGSDDDSSEAAGSGSSDDDSVTASLRARGHAPRVPVTGLSSPPRLPPPTAVLPPKQLPGARPRRTGDDTGDATATTEPAAACATRVGATSVGVAAKGGGGGGGAIAGPTGVAGAGGPRGKPSHPPRVGKPPRDPSLGRSAGKAVFTTEPPPPTAAAPQPAPPLKRNGSSGSFDVPAVAYHLERLSVASPNHLPSARGVASPVPRDGSKEEVDILRDDSVLRTLREAGDTEVAQQWMEPSPTDTISHVTWDDGTGNEVGVAIVPRKALGKAHAGNRALMAVQPAASFMLHTRPRFDQSLDNMLKGLGVTSEDEDQLTTRSSVSDDAGRRAEREAAIAELRARRGAGAGVPTTAAPVSTARRASGASLLSLTGTFTSETAAAAAGGSGVSATSSGRRQALTKRISVGRNITSML